MTLKLGVSFSGLAMRVNKPAIALADEVRLMQQVGRVVADPARAEHFLGSIGYHHSRLWSRRMVMQLPHIKRYQASLVLPNSPPTRRTTSTTTSPC